jgi:hypothetical protein
LIPDRWSSASRLAFAACGAHFGVGDLVGEQGVDLGGFGGGVAEAAAYDFDGDAIVCPCYRDNVQESGPGGFPGFPATLAGFRIRKERPG